MRVFCVAAIISTVFSASAFAQQCSHGPNEDAVQKGRRQFALSVVRAINTAEANEGKTKVGKYLPLVDLSIDLTKERMQGFEVQFTTDGKSYSFILRDTEDLCHLVFATNELGKIYQGYPIDFGVQPVVKTPTK
jgi:hypothetical protein